MVDKKQFRLLMIKLYTNGQLFIETGLELEGWIDKAFDLATERSEYDGQLRDKKVKDLLNWVKSDISQEENPKLGKTSTAYRRDKLKFLYKIEQMLKKE